jgi:TonB family protein
MEEKILFNRHGCLTLEALKVYSENNLTKTDSQIVADHLDGCDFCRDALEGISKSENAESIIEGLRKDLKTKPDTSKIKPFNRKTRYQIISIAASIAIILGLFFLLPKLNDTGMDSFVEIRESSHNPAETAPPLPSSASRHIEPTTQIKPNRNPVKQKRLLTSLAEKHTPEYTNQVFTFTDEMPEFPGGIVALNNYIQGNIREAEEKEKINFCGVVYVEFLVDEKGKVEQPKIADGHNQKLNEIALEVIEALPNWKPGRQSGQLVKVSFTLPIRFENC